MLRKPRAAVETNPLVALYGGSFDVAHAQLGTDGAMPAHSARKPWQRARQGSMSREEKSTWNMAVRSSQITRVRGDEGAGAFSFYGD